ncbi:MAG: exodeoxyribonuclease III [Coriobacteriia bacterium]|nr:exodeoxyribonuclease III [Coriobacteriia bacterium]
MLLISWNVNGIRAALNKGFLDFFESADADAFCLNETKAQPEQVELELPGYHQYWNSAERKGYSGTAIFSKTEPLSVVRDFIPTLRASQVRRSAVTVSADSKDPQIAAIGTDKAEARARGFGADELRALDTEGRITALEYPGFWLVSVYVPNSQDDLARIDHRMAFEDAFRAFCKKLDRSKPVVVCGDMNVAHAEIDLARPRPNRGGAGFSDQERGKFDELLAAGFVDSYRALHPTQTDAYTWWSFRANARARNVGWRIDYFLASARLMPQVTGALIYPEVTGSDHCPIGLRLAELS